MVFIRLYFPVLYIDLLRKLTFHTTGYVSSEYDASRYMWSGTPGAASSLWGYSALFKQVARYNDHLDGRKNL